MFYKIIGESDDTQKWILYERPFHLIIYSHTSPSNAIIKKSLKNYELTTAWSKVLIILRSFEGMCKNQLTSLKRGITGFPIIIITIVTRVSLASIQWLINNKVGGASAKEWTYR